MSVSKANFLQGYNAFTELMELALKYVSELLKPEVISPMTLDLYRGLVRILLILHHDFPEFLAETHFRLCNAIPSHATQLLNLILSAYPSSLSDLPNPFVVGLKIDRLEEIRRAPRIRNDYLSPLFSADIKSILHNALGSTAQNNVGHIVDALYAIKGTSGSVDSKLLHALVLYIGQSAVAVANQQDNAAIANDEPHAIFIGESPHATLLQKLFKTLPADGRYHLICSIVNQLRWPNAHTQYFSYALLHLYGTDPSSQQDLEARQQIVAVLLERIHVVLPHPWGLVVVMLELLKNPAYSFWALPFVKSSPQVRSSHASLGFGQYLTPQIRSTICARIS